jgi:hypothetical protein
MVSDAIAEVIEPPLAPAAPVRGTNSLALLALIFGVLGGLLSLPFGHIALSQIKRTGESGRGLAIAGLVLGYIYLAVIILFVSFGIGYSIKQNL